MQWQNKFTLMAWWLHYRTERRRAIKSLTFQFLHLRVFRWLELCGNYYSSIFNHKIYLFLNFWSLGCRRNKNITEDQIGGNPITFIKMDTVLNGPKDEMKNGLTVQTIRHKNKKCKVLHGSKVPEKKVQTTSSITSMKKSCWLQFLFTFCEL